MNLSKYLPPFLRLGNAADENRSADISSFVGPAVVGLSSGIDFAEMDFLELASVLDMLESSGQELTRMEICSLTENEFVVSAYQQGNYLELKVVGTYTLYPSLRALNPIPIPESAKDHIVELSCGERINVGNFMAVFLDPSNGYITAVTLQGKFIDIQTLNWMERDRVQFVEGVQSKGGSVYVESFDEEVHKMLVERGIRKIWKEESKDA